MRINSNVKSCIYGTIFLAVIAAVMFLVPLYYMDVVNFIAGIFPAVFPKNIADYLRQILIYSPGIIIWFFLFRLGWKFVKGFFLMRAEGIYDMFADKSGLAVHIFAHHYTPSGSDSTGPSSITVLHYVIRLREGKVFCQEMMSYINEPLSGRSGWGDEDDFFTSFEETIIKGRYLTPSMKKLSAKSGIPLALDLQSKPTKKKPLIIEGQTIMVDAFNTSWDKGFLVTSSNADTGKINWKRKI